jgi:UDP-N-acetylmuramoylalanine--D-glutamate ligase
VAQQSPGWLETADRNSAWPDLRVCVAGAGISGTAAADALLRLGCRVTVVDERPAEAVGGRATMLDLLGAELRLGPDAASAVPDGTQLVVTSPGWRPSSPMLVAAANAGVPVWGEVELAWRLRAPDNPAPWLVVTGTNGKTTTVRMLASMLEADGHRAAAVGNVGSPLIEAVLADFEPGGHDAPTVLAVELSSFQLHWALSPQPAAAAVLNVAPDHVDWHGSLDAYAGDKARAYTGTSIACVYNVQDPITEELLRAADVQEGCRAVGFTLGVPAVGMVGVVDDVLVDRAFVPERENAAAELATFADIAPFAPHNVADALAAAALARAYGVSPRAVRDGLRAFRPEPHRIAHVGEVGGVHYVDDSKATNPHAAAASLAAYDHVVWIAGGLSKGADFDDLIVRAAPRLRAAVLLGRDRDRVAAALARHAPHVPVVDVSTTDTGAMDEAVRSAGQLAEPGDTVLLAPACASMDLFDDYAARGDAFAAAVRRIATGSGESPRP